MTNTQLSVVVPALDEENTISGILADLRGLRIRHEVIVADGGSTDATVAVAVRRGARVVLAPCGRGSQLSAGARNASARMLWFVHADVRANADVLRAVERIVQLDGPGAFTFRFAIDASGASYRIVEWLANMRSRLAVLPYGDQSLLIAREDYDAAGGYPDIPVMEDVALARALRRIAKITTLKPALRASPRRWQRDGVLRRTVRNSYLLVAYLLGASPKWIAARYRPHGSEAYKRTVIHESAT